MFIALVDECISIKQANLVLFSCSEAAFSLYITLQLPGSSLILDSFVNLIFLTFASNFISILADYFML